MMLGIYGFGSIGRLIAKVALERGHDIVGVVDIDENIIGKDVGEVIGVKSIGVEISRDIYALSDADVVIHATGSYLDKVFNQITSIVEMGIHVVSTCETLAYPYYRYPILALQLDELAKDYGVAVIGTGINPGFLLDTLVVAISSSVTSVLSIKAVRSVDAAKRRESFRRKIGVGLDPKVVEDMLRKGDITGHVGYAESVYLIAYAGGLQLTKVVEYQEPIPAEEIVESAQVKVGKGMNKGIKGCGIGYLGDKEVIRIEFYAYVGAPEYEEITVIGKDYSVTWRSSGTPGDLGTAAVILNVSEKTPRLTPGLHLMTEFLPFKIRFASHGDHR